MTAGDRPEYRIALTRLGDLESGDVVRATAAHGWAQVTEIRSLDDGALLVRVGEAEPVQANPLHLVERQVLLG